MEAIFNPIEVLIENNSIVESIIETKYNEIIIYDSIGLSAYQIALQNGFVGTQEEWLQSLSVNSTSIVYEFANGTEHIINLTSLNNMIRPKSILFYDLEKENISVSFKVDNGNIYIYSNVDLNQHLMVIS